VILRNCEVVIVKNQNFTTQFDFLSKDNSHNTRPFIFGTITICEIVKKCEIVEIAFLRKKSIFLFSGFKMENQNFTKATNCEAQFLNFQKL